MIGQSGAAWMDADDEDANARVRACVRECRTRARSEWTRSFARSFRFESSRVACSSMAMTTSTTTTAMRMRMRESTTIRGRRAVVVSGRAGTTRRARGRDVEVRDDAMRTVCGGGWVGARGEGNGTRDIHSFIQFTLWKRSSLESIDRRGEARSNGSGDAREPGMRMKRDVRETDASSFRFADEGDVQLYARG